MSGAVQIPGVERDQTSQRDDPAQFLSKPGRDQPHTDSNRPERQTDPFLKRQSRADRLRGLAKGERENEKYAENAPNAASPARDEYDRPSRHDPSFRMNREWLPDAGSIT